MSQKQSISRRSHCELKWSHQKLRNIHGEQQANRRRRRWRRQVKGGENININLLRQLKKFCFGWMMSRVQCDKTRRWEDLRDYLKGKTFIGVDPLIARTIMSRTADNTLLLFIPHPQKSAVNVSLLKFLLSLRKITRHLYYNLHHPTFSHYCMQSGISVWILVVPGNSEHKSRQRWFLSFISLPLSFGVMHVWTNVRRRTRVNWNFDNSIQKGGSLWFISGSYGDVAGRHFESRYCAVQLGVSCINFACLNLLEIRWGKKSISQS